MKTSLILTLTVISLGAPFLHAQTDDTPIFEQRGSAIKANVDKIIEEALRVREQVADISKKEIDEQLIHPVPEPVDLPAPRTQAMPPEEIATHARQSNLRVGYGYLCTKCDKWHLKLAGGYAIAADTIVTCDHVMVKKTKMRDSFLVVADHEGNVALATAVLARSAAMDAAIVKVAGAEFTPVPLNRDVTQGTPAYCFSYPLSQEGYFSAGIVNRFFRNKKYRDEDPKSIDALLHLRANFSTDWAPGSSGSPLFDSAGNVIGHVSTIAALSSGKNKSAMLTLHTGIPALAVRTLAENLDNPDEIQRVAMLGSKKSKATAPEGEASEE